MLCSLYCSSLVNPYNQVWQTKGYVRGFPSWLSLCMLDLIKGPHHSCLPEQGKGPRRPEVLLRRSWSKVPIPSLPLSQHPGCAVVSLFTGQCFRLQQLLSFVFFSVRHDLVLANLCCLMIFKTFLGSVLHWEISALPALPHWYLHATNWMHLQILTGWKTTV